MGNVPISCCRSKSPRLRRNSSARSGSGEYGGQRAGIKGQYSSGHRIGISRSRRGDDSFDSAGSQGPSHNLQHISEREPDDSETDPSSNPFNRPIFAERSSSKNKNLLSSYVDSYSSSHSQSQKRTNTPLISSQDHGYNSATSTNLTYYDSFENAVLPHQLQNNAKLTALVCDEDRAAKDGKLLVLSSTTNSDGSNVVSPTRSISWNVNVKEANCENSGSGSQRLSKASSCSTIFVNNSTISQPNLEQTIRCVSLAIYYHIKNRTSDNAADIFDETLHPIKMPITKEDEAHIELVPFEARSDDGDSNDPDEKVIYSFIRTLFKAAQLTSEYAITTLVYLERLMTYSDMDLTPKTWRRMFLGAILSSSKVWEDQAVWNVDYAQILEGTSVEDINELESNFLELIQFNMNVPSSVYAKYYFHLRTLALKNGLCQERTLLTVTQARSLEAMSAQYWADWQSSQIHRKPSLTKRHYSLENFGSPGQTRAVLM